MDIYSHQSEIVVICPDFLFYILPADRFPTCGDGTKTTLLLPRPVAFHLFRQHSMSSDCANVAFGIEQPKPFSREQDFQGNCLTHINMHTQRSTTQSIPPPCVQGRPYSMPQPSQGSQENGLGCLWPCSWLGWTPLDRSLRIAYKEHPP